MAEITWSLMHPTPLDVDYMKLVVKNAPKYRVDSFEICADCHTNLGGMDGLTDYADFPVTHKSIDLAGIKANRKKLREVLAVAHSINKPVYYWHREAMVPAGLLTDRPDLLDSNGEFDLLGKAYEDLLRYKIDSSFKSVPELDGLVLTLTEATYSVIHNSNKEKYPPQKVVEHIVRIFASELASRGKRFILRSFGSIAQDYEDIIAGARGAAQEYGFEIETKITPYDFDPFLPTNPFLRSVPGATLGAECDCLGEFLGAGKLPAENVENIVKYVRTGQAAGVDRYAIRIDRVGNNIFESYEINLYAYERAIDDPEVTAETIRREWLEMHAPASAREAFYKLGIDGFRMVERNNFIDGHVIFHTFPLQKILKYVKAAYVPAFFKNGVSLKNGEGVWSVLYNKNTPGRDAIIREKEEAVAIADAGLELLMSLPREAGFEHEYAWRETLWRNATKITRTFLEYMRVIAAYFDSMEANDPEGKVFHAAAEEARKRLQAIAACPLEEPVPVKTVFVNGIEQHLFRGKRELEEIYIQPTYVITKVLEAEYEAEFAARKEFGEGSFDLILCGGLVDEWRIARYMHSAHSSLENGYQIRWAGNTVFPNGFLDMELSRPAGNCELYIWGDTEETSDFTCTVDGVSKQYKFDDNGCCRIALGSGAETVKVRLEKAPGVYYPRFRAVAVRN